MNATAPALSPILDRFVSWLSQLSERPNPAELKEQLRQLELAVPDLGPYVRFNETGYARNLILESEHAQLLCLCWRSGQRSPIHDHASSICGVRVVSGKATETRFEMTPSGHMMAVCSDQSEEGAVLVSEDADTHQIANLQREGEDLVTLHVYSPPLNRMKTYSLEGRGAKEYRPHNVEVLVDGGGI